MKTIFSFFLLLLCGFWARAEHITGGEMFYTFVGMSNGQYQYRGTIKLFKNCYSNRPLANPAIVSVFDKTTGARVMDITVPLTNTENISLTNPNKCITNPPDVCYTIGYYYFDVSLPGSSKGYILASQFIYRINGINNLIGGNVGTTYTAEIPPMPQGQNNSAQFVGDDMVAVCASNSFSYSFAAEDQDGDQLVYHFCEAYNGGGGAGATGSPAASPPYFSVPYGQGFDGGSPLGKHVQIDSKTGLIKGIAPAEGVYVVTVCVDEYRDGILIATQRKDLQINVSSCAIAAASLLPEYQLCTNSSTLNVANISTSPLIKTYVWELIDKDNNIIHSETAPSLSYSFVDTGLYKIKLVINRGLECSDSMNSVARVYPGLKADFDYTGVCLGKLTTFTNKSTTVYGQITSWTWDFGDGIFDDASSQLNPSYQYKSMGSKLPQLIVNTTKGCNDTLSESISIVDKPPMSLAFRDTIICVNDQLPLSANAPGGGSYSWSPAYNITNSSSATPVVTPATTTTYYVTLDDNGCINRDSVQVRVTDKVFVQAMNDTIICQNDPIQLKVVSDGLRFSWFPSEDVENAALPNTTTTTAATTTYEVTAFIGGCSAKDEIKVTAVPYPKVNAGNDTLICSGTTAQLAATTDGSSVSWTSSATLSQTNILNPIARPKQTTSYVITAKDNKGCPKPSTDTVLVTVLPPIKPFAGRDTAIVVDQPLQLNASGGVAYSWSPATGLSATNIANPVAGYSFPSEGIKYKVVVYNEAGCADSAYFNVKVFSTKPLIFVPTAFTPNGDGKNDKVRPIAAGMLRIDYFTIYNRWGQLVFSTQMDGHGWDGTIAGQVQNTGVFTWAVKAIDYTGKAYFQKGTVTLIR
jgi:gliding motility-associated-like protein